MVQGGSYAFWESWKRRTSYISPNMIDDLRIIVMVDDIRFYKGKHKVKVMTESKGNWIVEALEPFEDVVNGENVQVKLGERRIVSPNLLFKRKDLSPPVKEHTYELNMEKKLKHLIEDKEKKNQTKTS